MKTFANPPQKTRTKMEQKIWMSILSSALVLVTICNCASRHVPPTITKCEYYNQTACDSSGGSNGCGNEIQECQSAENDKPSCCFAVWTNNTITNQLSIKMKVT